MYAPSLRLHLRNLKRSIPNAYYVYTKVIFLKQKGAILSLFYNFSVKIQFPLGINARLEYCCKQSKIHYNEGKHILYTALYLGILIYMVKGKQQSS